MLAVLGAGVAIAGCGGDGNGASDTQTVASGCEPAARPAAKKVKLKRPKGAAAKAPASGQTATVETNCGSFVFALDSKRAPKTAGSFAYLVRKHVYDDTLIHRIEPDFVIQGGDPLGTGTGGPGYTVDEKPPGNLSYTRGLVAMARTAAEPPGRSGSQFFVVTAADAGLDPTYALLGKVTDGLDVVDRIAALGSQGGIPTETVVIRQITLGTAK
jgi:cyclophilin family peptidyl-prolyl cis-trans isomerase